MKKIKNSKTEQTSKPQGASTESTVEVLYQKLGERWYAFSLVDDEVFIGSISQEQIDQVQSKDC
jgi:hypothetical protein